MQNSATAISPTNLALIKYWGKRDTKLNLPINSSLSLTLDSRQLHTITTAYFADQGPDRLWVNDKEISLSTVPRTLRVLDLMRSEFGRENAQRAIHIVSRNSFPTAAGLASSASGYSAMVTALAGLFKVTVSKEDLSVIARQGSGSACRCLLNGGAVAWEMGTLETGSDSRAQQVDMHNSFFDLEAVICVVSEKKKKVSSTVGMQTSVKESLLLKHRAEHIVPERMLNMKRMLKEGDVQGVLELTMKDSNQFHATCLDTFPPIFYLTDTSREIIQLVTELNQKSGEIKFAYTFDAGPNAVVFCRAEDTSVLLQALLKAFPPPSNVGEDFAFVRGRSELTKRDISAKKLKVDDETEEGKIQYIFHTGLDLRGARVLEGKEEEERRLYPPQQH